jgi:hypothetical protein
MRWRHFLFKSYLPALLILGVWTEVALSRTHSHHSDLRIQFSTGSKLQGAHANHGEGTRWNESLFKIGLKTSFEATTTHGFTFSKITVRFQKPLALLERNDLRNADAQKLLFPNIEYSGCTNLGCRARQEVGPMLPDAQYISYYRFIKIDNAEQMKSLKVPTTLFRNTTTYPKYVAVQLATNWNNYFHRASSITTFEPGASPDEILVSSHQTLSLTQVGAMGKTWIKSSIEKQVQSFLVAFGRL